MNPYEYTYIQNLVKQAAIDRYYHSIYDVTPGIKPDPPGPWRPQLKTMPLNEHVFRAWRDRFRNPGDAMMDPKENYFNWRHGGHDRLAHEARYSEYMEPVSGNWRKDVYQFIYPGSAKVTKGPVGRRIGKGQLNHSDGAYRQIAEFGNRPAFTTAERKMLSKIIRNFPVGESTSTWGEYTRNRETLVRLLKIFGKMKRH